MIPYKLIAVSSYHYEILLDKLVRELSYGIVADFPTHDYALLHLIAEVFHINVGFLHFGN